MLAARRYVPKAALFGRRALSGESFLSGTSATYVEEMFSAYKKNPARCVEAAAFVAAR
jgi:hypothetical protein